MQIPVPNPTQHFNRIEIWYALIGHFFLFSHYKINLLNQPVSTRLLLICRSNVSNPFLTVHTAAELPADPTVKFGDLFKTYFHPLSDLQTSATFILKTLERPSDLSMLTPHTQIIKTS